MLFLTPKGLQMLVLGLRMMKMVLRKIFQIHQSLYLHTHPMVNGLSSCINHYISKVLSICQKVKQHDTVCLVLTANSSLFPHGGTSPSPHIMWSPLGSESSMQPPSCPPSNEGWPKEEPVKIWPKEEPLDVEMHPTPLDDPTPLPDHSMQPAPLTDTLFASPETWISSLPSMYALLLGVC